MIIDHKMHQNFNNIVVAILVIYITSYIASYAYSFAWADQKDKVHRKCALFSIKCKGVAKGVFTFHASVLSPFTHNDVMLSDHKCIKTLVCNDIYHVTLYNFCFKNVN